MDANDLKGRERTQSEWKYTGPNIGDGVTQYLFSDRHAYTVIAMSKSKKTLTIQHDLETRTDKNGMSDMQDYTFTPDPRGREIVITLRKDGRYREKGAQSTRGSTVYVVGHRRAYHDYSF